MASQDADYIVIGGGIGGCVVASRLSQKDSGLSIILLEAGPDVKDHPLMQTAATTQQVRTSELNWNYPSVPQKHLGGKICYNGAGKALGGGSAINAGKIQSEDLLISCRKHDLICYLV